MSNNTRLLKYFTDGDVTVCLANRDAKVEGTNKVYECLEFVFLLGMRDDSWKFKRQEDVRIAVNALVEAQGTQISFACQVLAGLGLAEKTIDPKRILGYRATVQLGSLIGNVAEQYGV